MSERPRPLPPLHSLKAFEAAARHASFTRAAEELNLTQGAVSRQILKLEERLGVALFRRAERGVHLTEAGEQYRAAVREALERIARATAAVCSLDGRGPITIGATSAMASLWVMSRLAGFRRHDPDLEIRVLASDHGFRNARDEVDLLILYARTTPAGDDVRRLFGEEIFPVCAPDYLAGCSIRNAEDLLGKTLLSLDDDHPDWIGWESWFAAHGIDKPRPRHSIRINSYPMLLQAAVAGQGIALGWSHLVDEALAAGTLVPVLPDRLSAPGAFYLCTLRALPDGSPAARLRDWLIAETRTETG